MHWLTDPQIWASLLTLTVLEIVLGIDNLVFVAIQAGRLPVESQRRGRQVGLALAIVTRLTLLACLAWSAKLTGPLFELAGHAFSWRDLILISGGFFLLYKGTSEIHHRLEGGDAQEEVGAKPRSFASVVVQIMALDAVFSLDSVITAIGMATDFVVMAAAIIIAMALMLAASGPLAAFIDRHPTVKMLALSFLLLIGMTLIADGAGFQVPKGYVYAAISFSIVIEALNQVAARRRARRRGAAAAESAPRPVDAGKR
jgi:predicted tellurium resistance membrane protein TerC